MVQLGVRLLCLYVCWWRFTFIKHLLRLVVYFCVFVLDNLTLDWSVWILNVWLNCKDRWLCIFGLLNIQFTLILQTCHFYPSCCLYVYFQYFQHFMHFSYAVNVFTTKSNYASIVEKSLQWVSVLLGKNSVQARIKSLVNREYRCHGISWWTKKRPVGRFSSCAEIFRRGKER